MTTHRYQQAALAALAALTRATNTHAGPVAARPDLNLSESRCFGRSLLLRFLAIGIGVGLTATTAPAATLVGSGPDASFIVIEATEFLSPLLYEYHYTYNAIVPVDTYAVLTAIDAFDTALSFQFINFGTAQSPNYFINAITLDTVTLTNTGAPDFSPFWFQSVSGGIAGFPNPAPIAGGVWSEGSGISSPSRTIEPGSWDGLVYGEFGDAPATAPVPEPAAWLLVALGGLLLVCRRHRSHA